MKTRRGRPVEWIGGNMMMPAAADEPEPLETFFWLNAEGDLLGTATYIASDMADRLADSYVATVESPEVGEPHVPTRIRVASKKHAEALRRAVGPETEVVCAPTPEIEPVRISLAAYLEKTGSVTDETYLSSSVTPEVVAPLFEAAARLYMVAPWRHLPANQTTASISINALGVRRAALVVVGKEDGRPALQLFPNEESASEFRVQAEDERMGVDDEDAAIPPHLALHFVRGADLDTGRRKEIAKHAWKVAGPAAYPEITAFDEDGMMRPATVRELAVLEAVSSAIMDLVEKEPALVPVLAKQEPFEHSVNVETSRGKVTVELSTAIPDDDVLGDLDDDDAEASAADILGRFEASPEHARLNETQDWAGLLLEHARKALRIRVEELTPVIVEEIVFESFPEKVMCPPEIAGAMVAEMRAFFAFLEREGLCREAAACGRLFDEKAEQTLHDRLSDPRNFGMAKTMMMAGIEAGYDLSTEEGLAAWLGKANEMIAGEPSGPASTASRRSSSKDPAKNAKRKKQKAARKTRKKSR